jgi:hypothetical protein
MMVRERRAELEREGRPMSKQSTAPCAIQPYKVIPARDMGWSIVDADFSRDARLIAYTSWSRFIHLASASADEEKHEVQHVKAPLRAYMTCS